MNTTTSRRTGFLAIVTVGLLALGAGCSDEQRRDLGEEDIRQSLTDHVEQVAGDQGVELDGDLTSESGIFLGELASHGSNAFDWTAGKAEVNNWSPLGDPSRLLALR